MNILLNRSQCVKHSNFTPLAPTQVTLCNLFDRLFNDYEILKSEASDNDGLEELRNILRHVGGFPLITDNWNPVNYNWIQAFVYSDVKLNSIHSFLDYALVRNEEANKTFIQIESPQYVLIGYALVDEDTSKADKIVAENEWRNKTKQKIRVLREDVNETILERDIHDVIVFDTKLANLSLISDEFVNPEEAEEMTIADMNEKFPHVCNYLTNNTMKGNLLKSTPVRTLANYISFKIIEDFGSKVIYKFKRIDDHRETLGPTVVNAFYTPNENKIEISTGILQPPNYFPNAPLAVNFGGIGTVIGHEITHGFDEEGSLYDHKGEQKKWWKIETWKLYKQKVNCFIKQYSEYVDPLTGIKINGKRTVGDNIADNGGVHQAFKAYKTYSALTSPEQDLKLPLQMSRFSKDQLFFIAFANTYCHNNGPLFTEQMLKEDEHSPPDARVMVPLMNSLYFSKAFNCSADSRMNPANKCVLW
ncbi:hypothetical protein B4U80_00351 [Leptotrombidium deliense]|uniref:Uncharacterized protein n=1 Tax=Leptotrombidium deliense TaxID=299467 RepID=A0A443SG53_9ACAR|nr:hypothetical protein B4U80_00351 [Leptotrombidium deliense]